MGEINWLGCVVVAAPNGAPLTAGTVVLTDIEACVVVPPVGTTDVEGCVVVPVRGSPNGGSLSSSVRPAAGREGPVTE